MLGINSGFKRNKPRQFEYKPRYFDPEKEEQKARSEAREGRYNREKYVPGSLVKGMRMERYRSGAGASDSHNAKRQAMEARNRTIFRLVLFLFLLLIVGYIVMNSTLLETVFSTFIK